MEASTRKLLELAFLSRYVTVIKQSSRSHLSEKKKKGENPYEMRKMTIFPVSEEERD